MPYDVTTNVGKVRLLLNDIDDNSPVFSDDELQAFLDIEGGSIKRAAAQAIDSQATNEALAAKVIKDHELTTDGAKLADAMRKHAAALRAQAKEDEGNADEGFAFEVVDIVGDDRRGPELTTWWP